MLTSEERAWLRLHLIPGLGRRGLFQLQDAFQSPQEAVNAGLKNWPEKVGALHSESARLPAETDEHFVTAATRLEGCQARIVSFWDDAYPPSLRTLHDPPALLYVRGSLPEGPALAVVGSRRCSLAGQQATGRLAREIAGQGVTIISGLARGIDSAAHQGALDADGATVAVLGCGIDRIYPRENKSLFHDICAQGAVISEYLPGSEPLAGHFPGRNRIISGLCRGVLVVEAARDSGSLITAEFALEQGREVFAMPGSISAPNSCGVNNLIKEGAHLVTEPQDILNILRPGTKTAPRSTHLEHLENLSEQEKMLIEQLSDEPVQIDDLARKSGLTPMELSAILLQLELRGTVCQLPGMRYIRSF